MNFSQCIIPQKATDLIVLVQYIGDKEIIIFDRKGRGEIWKMKDGIFVYDRNIYSSLGSFVDRAISTKSDQGTNIMLIQTEYGTDIELHDGKNKHNIKIGSRFRLHKEGNNVKIVIMKEQEDPQVYTICISIYINRCGVKKYKLSKDIIKEAVKSVKYEEYVVTARDYHKNRLDIEAFGRVPESYRNVIMSEVWTHDSGGNPINYEYVKSIYCYCKIEGKLICGHDGFVTVWS